MVLGFACTSYIPLHSQNLICSSWWLQLQAAAGSAMGTRLRKPLGMKC